MCTEGLIIVYYVWPLVIEVGFSTVRLVIIRLCNSIASIQPFPTLISGFRREQRDREGEDFRVPEGAQAQEGEVH